MTVCIAKTAIIHPNVSLGANAVIEDYVIIGVPGTGGEADTVIGDGAVIRSHTVIYAGNRIGDNFRTGNKVNIRENNTIGNNVSIGTMSIIEHHVTIGDSVRIHSHAFIPEHCILKNNVWIGPYVVLTNAKYPAEPGTKENLEGVVLEENCKIGASTTILPGVIVGANALVGAGSLVTRDIPPDVTAYGHPAVVADAQSR